MTVTEYTTAETAQFVRKSLKAAGIEAHVRKVGYNAIDVRVMNDDRLTEARAICKSFEGTAYDALTDYHHNVTGELNGAPAKFAADYILVQKH